MRFLEVSREVTLILHSDSCRYFFDTQRRGFQKLTRLLNPLRFEVLADRHAHLRLERMAKA
jgi:hypothetical protein